MWKQILWPHFQNQFHVFFRNFPGLANLNGTPIRLVAPKRIKPRTISNYKKAIKKINAKVRTDDLPNEITADSQIHNRLKVASQWMIQRQSKATKPKQIQMETIKRCVVLIV